MSETRLRILEGIARRLLVEATYNGARIKLAPHLLFERHGDHFVSAYNPAKAIRSDEEPRLGQFKLAGLNEAEVLDEGFDPIASFDAKPPREGDVVILAC